MIWILEIFKLCYGVKIKFKKTVKGIKIPDCTGGAICTKTYHDNLNYKQTLTRHCKLLLMVVVNSLCRLCWHFSPNGKCLFIAPTGLDVNVTASAPTIGRVN